MSSATRGWRVDKAVQSKTVSVSVFFLFFFQFTITIHISELTQSLLSLSSSKQSRRSTLLNIRRVLILFIAIFVNMDPLSMTTSFIAIAAATRSLHGLLKASKHCPNEISHLQAGLPEL